MGTQVLQRGAMFATKVPFLPQNGLMNSVHGLDDPALLPEVLAFYAATEQPCWVTVPPYLPIRSPMRCSAAGFRVESYSVGDGRGAGAAKRRADRSTSARSAATNSTYFSTR